MLGKTHREVALATSLAIGVTHLAVTQSFVTTLPGAVIVPFLWIPLSAPGGYLPDIDKKNTTANKWFRKYHLFFYLFIAVSLFIFPWYLAAIFLVTFFAFEMMVIKSVHRRETHSLFFFAALTGVFYFLSRLLQPVHDFAFIFFFNLLFGLFIGALTHSFADMFNKKQVHFMFPLEILLSDKDRPKFILPHWGTIITGTPAEKIFKLKWFMFCGIITVSIAVPSLLSFTGVEIMLLSEAIIVISLICVTIILWKILSVTVRKIFIVLIIFLIVYFLVTALLPGMGHLNFLRSIFR